MSQLDDKQKILKLLKALEDFPNIKIVRELREQLKNKLAKIESKERRKSEREKVKARRRIEAGLSRSSKLKKYHHYIRLIKDNYPDIPYDDIRRQFKARKEGKEVSIPDALWEDPSP
jgi:hypothetical protein